MGMLFPAAQSAPPGNAAQMRPDFVAGRGYRPHFGYTQSPGGTANFGSGLRLYLLPLFVPNAITLVSIFAAGSGGSARCGIYTDAGGIPGNLLVDGGLLAFGAGFQSWPINYSAVRGWYWFGGTCTNFFTGMSGSTGGFTTLTYTNTSVPAQLIQYYELLGADPTNPLPASAAIGGTISTTQLPYFLVRT
jgi:hypothetical protein